MFICSWNTEGASRTPLCHCSTSNIDTLVFSTSKIVTLVFHPHFFTVYMHNEEYLHVAIEYEETPASNQCHKWVEDLSNVCLHVYMYMEYRIFINFRLLIFRFFFSSYGFNFVKNRYSEN